MPTAPTSISMATWISMAAAISLFPSDEMAAGEKRLTKASEVRRQKRVPAAQRKKEKRPPDKIGRPRDERPTAFTLYFREWNKKKKLARSVSDALSAAAVAAAAASSVSAYAATASAAATADASAAAALAHRARRARCWTVKCNLYVFRLSARVRSTSSPVRSLGTDTRACEMWSELR